MPKKKTAVDIKILRRWIIQCCYWYYVECDPLISDRSFDRQFKELQSLEEAEGINDPTSPTQIIYGSLSDQYAEWAKVKPETHG